ncbi:hypothetical protein CDL12_19374 [Handroanthus impetiginosus]|uniref:CCDC93 coiled-coil domain-containing protein n=1 Tax=Handroanthus impetiginosus TaxID=429701 RepID=A0A2G9GRX4_9LAMI|nr:hypothetical protein CDL12_19374 [Handroanthus impetiginosus]
MAKDENEREADALGEVRILHERIDEECPNSQGWRLVSLLESLKELEKQEHDLHSQRKSDCSRLVYLSNGFPLSTPPHVVAMLTLFPCLPNPLTHTQTSTRTCTHENLGIACELATELRSIVSLKRQLDEVPSQAELMQYELRFSELNSQVQIKELMLKEIPLLNSISLQKLEKVQLALQSEQKSCDAMKEKYAAAISEQRQEFFSLEECARTERLRAQTDEHGPHI